MLLTTGKDNSRVEGRNVSMYPSQWAAVDQYARTEGFTVSLALRKIVSEWVELKARTLVDTRAPYRNETIS